MPRRVPVIKREDVPTEHRQAYDDVAAGFGGGFGSGPTSILVNSPEMARRANHLAEYLRKESALPQKIRELAMLIAARTMDARFIWNAHAALGRQAGLSDATVDSLRDRQPLPDSVPADEATAMRYGLEICQQHQVSDATFNACAGAVRRAGPHRVHYLHGLLPYSGLERQRFRHRPASQHHGASSAGVRRGPYRPSTLIPTFPFEGEGVFGSVWRGEVGGTTLSPTRPSRSCRAWRHSGPRSWHARRRPRLRGFCPVSPWSAGRWPRRGGSRSPTSSRRRR